jgi:hypothetical protein
MRKDSCYGDHLTLQALADALWLRIVVVTTSKRDFIINIEPAAVALHSVIDRAPIDIYLSLAAEHYGSVETSMCQ